MHQPLDGVRILDMSSVVMGPFATQLPGDLGADIIKVESPDGDILRHVARMRYLAVGHISLHHYRNKRSPAGKFRSTITSGSMPSFSKIDSMRGEIIASMQPQRQRATCYPNKR